MYISSQFIGTFDIPLVEVDISKISILMRTIRCIDINPLYRRDDILLMRQEQCRRLVSAVTSLTSNGVARISEQLHFIVFISCSNVSKAIFIFDQNQYLLEGSPSVRLRRLHVTDVEL